MRRYYTSSLFVFSILGGIVTVLFATGFTEEPAELVFFGALTTLLISIIIPMMFAISDRRYIPVRKEIKEPIVIDERVNYIVGNEVRQGFMLATEKCLYVISVDNKKVVKFEINKNDVKKVSISDDVYLNIFLDYDKCIRIFSANCDELLNRLKGEGFGK